MLNRLPAALRQVGGNRSLLWLEAGWLAALAGEGAYVVSLLVLAYDAGGLVAVGLATLLRALPSAILGPMASFVTDRFPRTVVLAIIHLGRAGMVGIVALSAMADIPLGLTLVAVGGEGLLAVVHRAATWALMPALARAPEELVAANGVASFGEAVGELIGPVGAGVLLVIGGPWVGLLAAAAAHLVAGATTLPIEMAELRRASPPEGQSVVSRMAGVLAGFAALHRNPSAGLVVGLFTCQTLVRGLVTVLLVSVAVDQLSIGEAGVGYLVGSLGAGGLAGAGLAVAVLAEAPIPRVFAASLAAWGLPVAVLGLVSAPAAAFALLALVGAANAVLDIAGNTLLQRCVPNVVRGRVFGALESAAAIGMAGGAALAPSLVGAIGLTGALVVAGVLLLIVAVATYPRLRRADARVVIPQRELELLRRVPMFTPLPLTSIEYLAQNLRPVFHAADERIVTEGDIGDAFYIVATGTVAVVHDQRRVATLGPGAGFGEIALLRDRPRTASVVALEPVEAFRLPRGAFLEAVTGSAPAMGAADDLVARRLAGLPDP